MSSRARASSSDNFSEKFSVVAGQHLRIFSCYAQRTENRSDPLVNKEFKCYAVMSVAAPPEHDTFLRRKKSVSSLEFSATLSDTPALPEPKSFKVLTTPNLFKKAAKEFDLFEDVPTKPGLFDDSPTKLSLFEEAPAKPKLSEKERSHAKRFFDEKDIDRLATIATGPKDEIQNKLVKENFWFETAPVGVKADFSERLKSVTNNLFINLVDLIFNYQQACWLWPNAQLNLVKSVVFLDVDGVLVTLNKQEKQIYGYAEAEKRFFEKYKRYPDAKNNFEIATLHIECFSDEAIKGLSNLVLWNDVYYVLSSTWGKKNLKKFFEEKFPAGFRHRIIGKTPHIRKGFDRDQEIGAWLEEHGQNIEHLGIVDDQYSDLFEKSFKGHYVQTDLEKGLTSSDVEKMQAILEKDYKRVRV